MPEEVVEQMRPKLGKRRRAIARIVLGQAQILAATVGVVLLFYFGTAWPTLVAVGVAGALVLTSKLLFRDRAPSHLTLHRAGCRS